MSETIRPFLARPRKRSQPRIDPAWYPFLGVFTVTFVCLLPVGLVLPVLPRFLQRELGAGDLVIGLVIGIYAIAGLLSRPLAGLLTDSWGRRQTTIVGAGWMMLSGGLCLLPFGLGGIVASRLALGVAEGTVFTACSAWNVDLAPDHRRGRYIGIHGLAAWGALGVGPIGGEIAFGFGGYTAVWIAAAVAPLGGAAIALAVPDGFRPGERREARQLIAPEALGPGAVVALVAVGYAIVATFLIIHLEERGVGHGDVAFAVFAVTIVLTRIVAGDLPDQIGAGRVAAVTAAIEAVGLLILGLASSPIAAFVGALTVGFAFSLLLPALTMIAVEHVSAHRRGAAFGTFTACFDVGFGLGAPIVGALAALAGYPTAFAFAAGASLLAAATVAIRARGPWR